MTAVDLSSFAGLTAMVLLSLNVLLGLLVTTNYSPLKQWPRRKVPVFKIHNWTGYAAMCVVLLHHTLLLFSSTASFKALDILWPVHSPGQRLYNLLGATAFYTITLVVVTSYFRPRLGSRTWKKLHWTAYFAARPFDAWVADRSRPEEQAARSAGWRKGAGGRLPAGRRCRVGVAHAALEEQNAGIAGRRPESLPDQVAVEPGLPAGNGIPSEFALHPLPGRRFDPAPLARVAEQPLNGSVHLRGGARQEEIGARRKV